MQDIINNLFEKANAIGGNVLIADKEGIKEQFTYGFQSKEKNIPTSKDTIYRIASISGGCRNNCYDFSRRWACRYQRRH